MTSAENAGFSARIDAVLAEQERSLGTLRQDSADRATRGTADAAAATARFSRLAERVRQGARDRARPTPRGTGLAFDDPIAELEALIEPPPPDPDEPDDAEVEDILDTLLPLRAPAGPTPVVPVRHHADGDPDDADDDFREPW